MENVYYYPVFFNKAHGEQHKLRMALDLLAGIVFVFINKLLHYNFTKEELGKEKVYKPI